MPVKRVCTVQGGIVYSNVVTTVSPTYAREATEDGAAGWLKSTLLRPDISEKFEVALPPFPEVLFHYIKTRIA